MSGATSAMICGNISRYIYPRWILNGELNTEAFDLRDGDPPETYVSHFFIDPPEVQDAFTAAHKIISAKIRKCHKGSIAIFEISEALEEVNDPREEEPFIGFFEKTLPHCGLVYLTTDQESIQEAKATLCILAQENILPVTEIIKKPPISIIVSTQKIISSSLP